MLSKFKDFYISQWDWLATFDWNFSTELKKQRRFLRFAALENLKQISHANESIGEQMFTSKNIFHWWEKKIEVINNDFLNFIRNSWFTWNFIFVKMNSLNSTDNATTFINKRKVRNFHFHARRKKSIRTEDELISQLFVSRFPLQNKIVLKIRRGIPTGTFRHQPHLLIAHTDSWWRDEISLSSIENSTMSCENRVISFSWKIENSKLVLIVARISAFTFSPQFKFIYEITRNLLERGKQLISSAGFKL